VNYSGNSSVHHCNRLIKQYVVSPACCLQNVGSKDAAVERTGMYLQRVCKQHAGETTYTLIIVISQDPK